MGKPSDAAIQRTFEIMFAAAVAGEPAPMNIPNGPINPDALKRLVEAGRLSVEVYGRHFRRVVIPTESGEIATARCPHGGALRMVNGVQIERPLPELKPSAYDVLPRTGSPSQYLTTASTVPKCRRLISVAPLPAPRTAAFSFGDPEPNRSELARRLAEQGGA